MTEIEKRYLRMGVLLREEIDGWKFSGIQKVEIRGNVSPETDDELRYRLYYVGIGFDDTRNRHRIDTAKGEELDALAVSVGLRRR